MKASEQGIEKSIRNISVYLVKWIENNYNCGSEVALHKLMGTVTYATLIDKETKLFSESKEYVLDMLISEINNNIENWMKI